MYSYIPCYFLCCLVAEGDSGSEVQGSTSTIESGSSNAASTGPRPSALFDIVSQMLYRRQATRSNSSFRSFIGGEEVAYQLK